MKKNLIIILTAIVLVAGGIGVHTYFKHATPDTQQDSNNATKSQESNEAKIVAKNLDTPWSLVFYNDIPLVSSRDTGIMYELDDAGAARSIGTIENVKHVSESGLLGLAVQGENLYAYYTTNTDNRISRYKLSGSAGSLSIGQETTILTGIPSATYHNGGRLAIGPDDKLYATTGDAGTTSRSQDVSDLGGKILRMNLDGSVPSDNPFENSLVYSYGHRNPQGIAWSEDGTMYSSELGQNTWDELNVITAGANYGWPNVEGVDESNDKYTNPVQQWPTNEASPSGMAYANGALYIANLRGEVLRKVETSDVSSSETLYKSTYGRIRDAAFAPDGTVWFVTNNTDGRGEPSADDDKIISIPAK